MRLTLRTMLCYLDDILEPEDKADLGKKIDDSPFATTLVHRIRDVTQRMRLGTPKVASRGMGLDANTVAEYLDNVLSAERIPDFEKVCLESDVHLAEVAASHQILTLVLGEPAQVDAGMRRRVYDLGGGSQAIVDGAHSAAAHGGPPPRPAAAKAKPEIPDYLRETRGIRWWTIAATLLVAAGAGAIAVVAIGPEKVATMLGMRKAPDPQVAQHKPDGKTGIDFPADLPANSLPGPGDGDPLPLPETPIPNVVGNDNKLPIEPAPPIPTDPPVKPEVGVNKPPVVPTDPVVPSDPPQPAPTDVAIDVKPKPPIDDVKPLPPDGSNTPPVILPKPIDPPAIGDAAGLCVVDEETLLRWNAAGRWERVGVREQVKFGDALLVCPTYRPIVLLSSGISMQIAGDTFVQLEGPDKNGIPGINIGHGRVIFTAAGRVGTRLRVIVGDRSGIIVFGEGASEVACEVRLFHPPGSDPEQSTSQAAAELYANSGVFRWSEKVEDQPQLVSTPNRVVLAPYPGEAADMTKELPRWTKAELVSDIDRRASKILFKALAEATDIALRLREMATHRNIENRSLAIRCLAELGEFEDLVASLRDEEQKSMWQPYVESLQAALARDPKRAATIRLTLEKQRAEKGADLYRMLWGYSKADLEGGQATKLVEFLDHEDLDYRVLAFMNLKNITGMTLLYRPEASALQRKQAVQSWKQRLKDGSLTSKLKAAG